MAQPVPSRVPGTSTTRVPYTGRTTGLPPIGTSPVGASRIARQQPQQAQPPPPIVSRGSARLSRSDLSQPASAYAQQPSLGAVGLPPPGASRVARTPTGPSVPLATTIPVRSSRVAGNPFATNTGATSPYATNTGTASPYATNTGSPYSATTGSPYATNTGAPYSGNPIPPTRVGRVAGAATPVDASNAMAPARSSSRSVSAFNAPAAPTPRSVLRARRVSKVIVDKERKTDYWQEIMQAASATTNLSQEDTNNIISRAMSLDIVGNWKQRESSAAPSAQELFQVLEVAMQERITELSNGRPVAIPGTGIDKIRAMEPILAALEAAKEKEDAEQEEKVKAKVSELHTSLRVLQEKKEAEVANKRRTVSLELNNLREQMLKASQDGTTPRQDAAALAEKVNRLEAALRLMNEERKQGVEDKETMLLKKKLAVFEAKLNEVSEAKKLAAAEDHGSAMREKLLLMEDKLKKMERRKSVSITMMMQQKMQEVEAQIQALRVQGGGGGGGGGSNDPKIAALEQKLLELQNTRVTPAMVNDAETNALRAQVAKLEEGMRLAEQKMEEQRMKVEQERMMAWKRRQEEEEEYRKKARMREEMLLQKNGGNGEKNCARGSTWGSASTTRNGRERRRN
eukprot:TRINITY_DN815_c0_g3_i1.p1 TRINITY_DN815_c0_g3~~TRINITY_DN815_c0_g3_i1.p1  ORF type:complete len:628 (-),score=182.72 TRINITY_DN815_c0_g3_i1:1200-3083(-)